MDKENIEKASSFLPEAWYGLIARLVPGGMISAATLSYNNVPPSQLDKQSGVVIDVFMGYAVGLLSTLYLSPVFPLVGHSAIGFFGNYE